MNALIDTNVIGDLLTVREPFFADSSLVLEDVKAGKMPAFRDRLEACPPGF